ncbi:translation elongation factor P (EF-P) [Orenia metallireducens]|jgi:elongation factor P|uniref:Elongation factor P n=1 Tax=Orenia metallireducens TaxID=1413210 RepID=A0A285I5G1_9FIRM|nr:elongation factor P [Orenia metallireducens]PRX19734.1 translation elongation factor P (EF-P) [Orenia metallireducens]SNY43235.1 translation elongation factor P (EF-P) [Orenia metallireducens]
MISTSDFKPGMTIEIDGKLYSIMGYDHVKPGKGGAFLQTKLREIESGRIINKRFRAGEKVNQAYVDTREYQYLYRSGDDFVFMDKESYVQLTLTKDQIGDSYKYIKENSDIQVQMYQNNPIGIAVPDAVELEVIQSPPAVKGNTVSGGTKDVTVETGVEVTVPLFVNKGDILKIDTSTGEYMERVNK